MQIYVVIATRGSQASFNFPEVVWEEVCLVHPLGFPASSSFLFALHPKFASRSFLQEEITKIQAAEDQKSGSS